MKTLLPLYYLFYLTGMLLLGDAQEAAGYRAFLTLWHRASEGEPQPHVLRQLVLSFQVLGVPALLGCLPWAIGGAWIAYSWSLRIAARRQRKRFAREREAARRAGAAPPAV